MDRKSNKRCCSPIKNKIEWFLDYRMWRAKLSSFFVFTFNWIVFDLAKTLCRVIIAWIHAHYTVEYSMGWAWEPRLWLSEPCSSSLSGLAYSARDNKCNWMGEECTERHNTHLSQTQLASHPVLSCVECSYIAMRSTSYAFPQNHLSNRLRFQKHNSLLLSSHLSQSAPGWSSLPTYFISHTPSWTTAERSLNALYPLPPLRTTKRQWWLPHLLHFPATPRVVSFSLLQASLVETRRLQFRSSCLHTH